MFSARKLYIAKEFNINVLLDNSAKEGPGWSENETPDSFFVDYNIAPCRGAVIS